MLLFIPITVILEMNLVIFCAQNLTFGRPVAPWETMGRSRGTWEHKKGDLGIQALIFIDFGMISGPHFDSFSGTLDQNMCLCHACFQVTFLNHFGV